MRCELFYKFTAEIKNQIQNNQKLELLDLRYTLNCRISNTVLQYVTLIILFSDNSMPEEELQEMLDYLKTRSVAFWIIIVIFSLFTETIQN